MNKPIVRKIPCGAVVMNNGKVLIVKRSSSEENLPNIWELPSGRKENMESLEQAVVREVKEETGLAVSAEKPFHTFSYSIEKENEIRDTVQVNYKVKLIHPDQPVVLSHEHQSFVWVLPEEISGYDLSLETRNAIELAIQETNRS